MMAAVSNARLAGEGVTAGFVGGAVAHLLWTAGVAAGVPEVIDVPGQGVVALAWWSFAAIGVASGFGAALVALLLDGRRRARTLFLGASAAVLVASVTPFASQPEAVARTTMAVLAVGHVVVFAAVVPRLARRLRAR
jgi:hypothetical protein